MTATPEPVHLVLDWNGTLLDDLDLAVRSVNVAAERFGLGPITHDRYRALFDFPIVDFYGRLGFDTDSIDFDDIAAVYLGSFDAGVADCPLHPGVVDALAALAGADGVTVSILSASYEPTLRRTLAHKGLDRYVDNVVGVGDQRATSKLAAAGRLAHVVAGRTLLLGDTSHDKDIADALGWDAHLVTCGHQSPQRLARLGATTWPEPHLFMTELLLPLCDSAAGTPATTLDG